MDAIPIGIGILDLSGTFLRVNRRVADTLGLDQDWFTGRDFTEVMGFAADPSQDRETLLGSMRRGWHGVATITRRDGSPVPIFLETGLISDAAGAPAFIVGVGRDISDQRALQTRLATEERAGTLGLLARNLTHQLRNHLASVLMSVHFLEESLGGHHDVMPQLDAIRQEVNRMRLFLDSLTDVIQPSVPDMLTAGLLEVIEEGLSEARPILLLKSITVKRQFPRPSPRVQVDRHQIARAIAQVVQNAAESMTEGGEIHVVVKRQRTDARTLWLVEVRDNGCGVPPYIRARVFEPFFSTTRTQLGLGLTFVRHVMEQHGGSVRLDSMPGRGTTVTLSLPETGEAET